MLPFDHQISNALGPVEANLLELLLCWLLGALLGLVLFVLNLTVNRSAGAICAAALAIFPLFVERAGWWMHYISPVSWASLSVVDLTGTTAFPSLATPWPCWRAGTRCWPCWPSWPWGAGTSTC